METPVTLPTTEWETVEPTPSQPILPLDQYRSSLQFTNLTFKDAKYTAKIGSKEILGNGLYAIIEITKNDEEKDGQNGGRLPATQIKPLKSKLEIVRI